MFTRFSGRTDSRTHSQTDRPECSMPPAPFFDDGRSIKARLRSIGGYSRFKTPHVIARASTTVLAFGCDVTTSSACSDRAINRSVLQQQALQLQCIGGRWDKCLMT